MSMWDGIEDAEMRRESEYIRPGRYLFQIRAFRGIKTRRKGRAAVFNLNVLHVFSDEAAAEDPMGAHRPGDEVSWMLMKSWDSFFPTIKKALVKMTGCDPSEVTPAMLVELTDEQTQPMAGQIFEANVRQRPTQKGGWFTNVTVIRAWTVDETLDLLSPELATQFNIGGEMPPPEPERQRRQRDDDDDDEAPPRRRAQRDDDDEDEAPRRPQHGRGAAAAVGLGRGRPQPAEEVYDDDVLDEPAPRRNRVVGTREEDDESQYEDDNTRPRALPRRPVAPAQQPRRAPVQRPALPKARQAAPAPRPPQRPAQQQRQVQRPTAQVNRGVSNQGFRGVPNRRPPQDEDE